jgi:hypothetical protein
LASEASASQIGWLIHLPTWIWWIFPGIYMAADFLEDAMIIFLLASPERIGTGNFAALSRFTATKIVSLKIAFLQVASLVALMVGSSIYSLSR